MKINVKKLLLTRNSDYSLEIEEKELNVHIPINRYLDRPGYFSFTFEDIDGKKFLLVFEGAEEDTTKTKMLVTKIGPENQRMEDISSEDSDQIAVIAEKYMGIKTKRLN